MKNNKGISPIIAIILFIIIIFSLILIGSWIRESSWNEQNYCKNSPSNCECINKITGEELYKVPSFNKENHAALEISAPENEYL